MKKDKMLSFVKKFCFVFPKRQRMKLFFLLFLVIIGSILETVSTYVILPFVNAVMNTDALLENSLYLKVYDYFKCDSVNELIMILALSVAILYVIKMIYNIIIKYVQLKFLALNRSYLSSRLFKSITDAPYQYFLHSSTAEIQRLLLDDIKRLFNLLEGVLNLLSSIFTGGLILLVLFIVSPTMTVFVFSFILILMLILNKFIAPRIEKLSKEDTLQYTAMLKWIQQFVGGVKSILANKRQQTFINNYSVHSQGYARLHSDMRTYEMIPVQLIQGGCLASIFMYMAIVAKMGSDMKEMIPILATLALAAMRLLPTMAEINQYVNLIRFNQQGLELVYERFTEANIDLSVDEVMIKKERKVKYYPSLEKGIFVEDITFRFQDADKDLFNNISLFIPAKKSVAFIGTTGAGKTTLADIIIGLQKISKGKVLVDDHDISLESDWWADQIGYIPQFVYLCDDTIRNNIALGISEADIDDDKIWKSIREAQLEDFIKSLPNGLDTLTGENGIRLSGGQRQRIGIARALYTNPSFIVLDEATSALDQETEKTIIEAINNLAGEKTLLIIAHRLTTIKNCDIVYRVENGSVITEKVQGE